MTDILLPMQLRQASTSFRYLDKTGLSSPTFNGPLRTASFGGDKLAATVEFTKHGGTTTAGKSERAIMKAFLVKLKGRQNRALLTDLSYRRRGSFPAVEMLSNNTFSGGTTGWTAAADASITATDGVMRVTRTANSVTGAAYAYHGVTGLVQYAPYVLRAAISAVNGTVNAGVSVDPNGFIASFDASSAPGIRTLVGRAVLTSSFNVFLDNVGALASVYGEYFDVQYTSMSRCAVADNGPNALLQSDTLATTWASSGLTGVTSNFARAPDGNTTADKIVENSSAGTHYLWQSGARTNQADDLCAYGYFKRGAGSRFLALNIGNDGTNYGIAIFDLGGGGGIASPAASFGTATEARAFSYDAGDGWVYCAVVARLPAAATIASYIQLSSGTTLSYTGDGSNSILAWRCGAGVCSTATRGSQTVAAAASSGVAQTGSGLYLRGLPASTNGLLEIDDQLEVITSRGSELKIVTARLNSNGAGLGFVQFEPPLRGTPADGAAVIIHQPMGKFIYAGESVGWNNSPGFWTDASCEFEEAV